MIKHIPNTLTLANLFCGCIGIVQVFGNNLQGASYLILLAAVFDFLDGFAARLLKAASVIGKDLDSLADVITFGLLPSFILYSFLEKETHHSGLSFISYSAFLVVLFSALRLARFNNDPRQSDRFIGVPTPANALLIASFPFVSEGYSLGQEVIGNPWSLLAVVLVLSWLLVAEIPLLALKFKGFQWEGNQYRYILAGISVLLLMVLKWASVPLIMVAYLVLSFLENIKTRA